MGGEALPSFHLWKRESIKTFDCCKHRKSEELSSFDGFFSVCLSHSCHLVFVQEHVGNALGDGKAPPRLGADQRPFQHVHVQQKLVDRLQKCFVGLGGLVNLFGWLWMRERGGRGGETDIPSQGRTSSGSSCMPRALLASRNAPHSILGSKFCTNSVRVMRVVWLGGQQTGGRPSVEHNFIHSAPAAPLSSTSPPKPPTHLG